MATPAISETLQNLAPKNLDIRRANRYDGGGMSVSLKDFDPEDISLILRVYATIKTIYDIYLYAGMHQAPLHISLFKRQLDYLNTTDFISSARAIGTHTHNPKVPNLRKVVHDIRGGCLMSLVGYAGLLETDPGNVPFLKTAVSLARDHAKMMRNAIQDLDVPVRIADESLKIHSIDNFVEKLDGAVIKIADKTARIAVCNAFHGNISNRCLETSAIDRIVYNLLNNAARFAHDQKIRVAVFQPNNRLVRWVVQNAISGNQRTWLEQHVGPDLGRLFTGGITREGSGIGLNNCAEFVSQSFGLSNPQDAIEKGYVGATCIDLHFYAWFHWPVYIPESANEPFCTCKP